MSTTDRAAFEQYAQSQGCNDFEYDQDDSQHYRNPFTQREYKYWRAALDWQAATEAAKATGTAGGQMSKTEIDAIVYKCRQSGNDTTYDIVNACLAARQPAPVVAVKTWQERMFDNAEAGNRIGSPQRFMRQEIADLRAALAATNRSQP